MLKTVQIRPPVPTDSMPGPFGIDWMHLPDSEPMSKQVWIEHVSGEWDWVISILLAVLVLWAVARLYKPGQVQRLTETFFSNRFIRQLMREDGMLRSDVNLLLLANSWVVIALFFLLTLWTLVPERTFGSAPEMFVLLLVGLIVLSLVRFVFIALSEWIFGSESLREYNFNLMLFSQGMGLVLFPVVLCTLYVSILPPQHFVWIGWGIIAVFYLGRVSKSLYIGTTTYGFSPLYILMYLCGLEIMPLLIGGKLINNYMISLF